VRSEVLALLLRRKPKISHRSLFLSKVHLPNLLKDRKTKYSRSS
jgi:hypothetical protein